MILLVKAWNVGWRLLTKVTYTRIPVLPPLMHYEAVQPLPLERLRDWTVRDWLGC